MRHSLLLLCLSTALWAQQTAVAPAGQPAAQQSPAPQATNATPTAQTAQASHQQCLIVTSNEGHRFRNSMIAGELTGGIGLAAGAAFSGGRYEYRDSTNLNPSDMKMKYKGPELQKIQQKGVHVIIVNKKDKTGDEVKSAR